MKRTPEWLAVVCVVTLVLSGSATALAQPRFWQRGAPTLTRDMLVDRFGLSPEQADKVIKVHQRHAANMEKVQEKLRQQTENIRKSETKALSKIVDADQLRELERLLRRGRGPFAPGPGGLQIPVPRFDIGRWKDWLTRLTNFTPEQKEKLDALVKSHREQLRKLHERFREGFQDILTSEQMERFRSRFRDMRPREGS